MTKQTWDMAYADLEKAHAEAERAQAEMEEAHDKMGEVYAEWLREGKPRTT